MRPLSRACRLLFRRGDRAQPSPGPAAACFMLSRLGIGLLLALAFPAAADAACPPTGQTRDSLRALRSAKWALADATQRQALAIGLLDCLASPDPLLRDDIAFEGLQHWLRAGALDPATARRIADLLLPRVTPEALAADVNGVAAPFAALALAEVARVDRRTPLYSPAEREALVQAAARFLTSVRDYRGFDPKDGWRHGVAHGADWLLQLSLNPALDRRQLDRLLDAIATQVLPSGSHSYVFGEGQRLMQPVLYIAARGLHDAAFFTAWLGRIAAAAAWPVGQPLSQAALSRTHNARGFLWPLYVAVQESSDPPLRARLLPGLQAALRTLP